jgi:hypothetical protein
VTGKASDRAAVTDGMRDTSKGALVGLVPNSLCEPVAVKCSREKCNRPTTGGYKTCSRCRSYARDRQRRDAAGNRVARAYCEALWAKGAGK